MRSPCARDWGTTCRPARLQGPCRGREHHRAGRGLQQQHERQGAISRGRRPGSSTELNRAQVSWTGKQADVVIGRQRIVLGNARFVGNVGFRQNEQTFDAIRIGIRPTKDFAVTYAYVDRVRRVFGHRSAQGEWDSDSHLIQADLKTPAGQASGYSYLLDFGNAPTQSSATWGGRFAGSRPIRPGARHYLRGGGRPPNGLPEQSRGLRTWIP